MPHPIEDKIAAVGRRVWWVWMLAGLGWLLAVLVALALALVGADYLIRYDDLGLRVMSSLVWLLVAGWALYRFLWTPLVARVSPLETAQRVQRRFPALGDRLASSVEFLTQDEHDARSGSAELRRAVIHDTALAIEPLDLLEVVDRRAARQAWVVGAAALLAALALAIASPTAAWVGLARLALPLSPIAWPQQYHLTLAKTVRHVARGQALEVEVVERDGKQLPGDLWLLTRTRRADGGVDAKRQLVPALGASAVARQENVTLPLAYRVIGGDDRSMPWTRIEVVDPPAVREIEMRLHFPQYTAWPERPTDKHLRAIVGTQVSLQGKATKPLRSATLVYEDGREIALAVSEDRRGFSLAADAETPMVIDKTGAYWFVLEDLDGLRGGGDSRYEMRAVPDLEPKVSIDAPAADTFVTPQAIVPIKITATDDLALASIAIGYLRSDQSDRGEQQIELYTGPKTAPPPTATELEQQTGERREVEYRWELMNLAMTPGTVLTVHAAASDYQPKTGQSLARRITIIAPGELELRLEERHARLLSELARVHKLQQAARSQVREVEIQVQQVGQLEQTDLDRLQAAGLAQRQVDRALADQEGSLRSQLAGLLADIENNQLNDPEIAARAQGVSDELSRLAREYLPQIDQSLTRAEKDAKTARHSQAKLPPEVSRELAAAGAGQDEVEETLGRLVGDLSLWDSQRRVARELADLEHAQQELQQQTAEVGRETVSSSVDRLTPQQRADLAKLASQQQELARRLQDLQQSMGRAAEQIEVDDPLGAQAIADAVDRMRSTATGGRMQEAARGIEANQIGQTGATQQQVVEDLQEARDILANRQEHELARLVKKLREAENQLAELRQEQAGLKKKIEAAQQLTDAAQRQRQLEQLRQQERKLAEQTEQLARRLQRLQAQQAGASLAQAGGQMRQGEEASAAGQDEQARDALAEAERDLAEAQQQLAERRKQAERDLAAEQLAKTEDQLVALRQRQEQAVKETHRLEALRAEAGQFSRAQLSSVLEAARTQEGLAAEAQALANRLAPARAFALALEGVEREMRAAVDGLRRQETGAATERRQRQAEARLAQLIAAMAPEKPEPNEQQQNENSGGAGQGGAGGEQPPGERIPDVAQLKLVKLMQEELNQRTADTAQRLATTSNNADLQEYVQLGEEQAQLAKMMGELSSGDPDESPAADDGLPGLDDDPLDEPGPLPQ